MSQVQAKVFIVDDDRDFRESLTWLLQSAGYQCRVFESAETFLQHYAGEPGCLLLDIRMSGMSGLALQQTLKQRDLVLPVIIITGHGDVTMAVQAMKNNAVDFIEKPFNDEMLLKLVDDTLQRSQDIFSAHLERQAVQVRWDSLSKREQQVAQLVVQGKANREIAAELDISIKTVEIHRSRVMSKMHVNNLARLVDAWALIRADK
jgi:two-component system, LuxR family, response regulator FixJ